MKTDGGWFSPDKAANQTSLLKNLGPILAKRSKMPSYIDAQTDAAKTTVAEFARKWMREQSEKKLNADLPIKVFFEGEVH